MSSRATSLLSPLNLAGYVAWGGIGWELMFSRWQPPAGVALQAPPWLLGLMHLGFLVQFMVVISGSGTPRQRQALVLGQLLLALALMLLARSSTLPILMVLCAIQVVYCWRPVAAGGLLLVANAGVYLVFREAWQLGSPLVTLLMNLSFQAFAALTAWFAFRAEETRDELAAAHADLLATRSLLAETARDSERLRLSRELHDVAGHKLTALKLNLAAMARDPRHAGDGTVHTCARLADELLADIRGVVQQMRADEGLELGSALEALAGSFPRPRLQLQIDPSVRVASLAQAEAVLRAVQEGLTNAARHSQAQNLWVVLQRDADGLHLDIRDDGRGRGELQPGNGLRGMHERLQAVGGELHVGRTDTGGVHLRARLPGVA